MISQVLALCRSNPSFSNFGTLALFRYRRGVRFDNTLQLESLSIRISLCSLHQVALLRWVSKATGKCDNSQNTFHHFVYRWIISFHFCKDPRAVISSFVLLHSILSSLNGTGRTNPSDLAVIGNSLFQQGHIGTHKPSHLASFLEKIKGWHRKDP